jgi:chromosomal replication initiator protein
MTPHHETWQAVLAELELNISKANFNAWLKNTGIISLQDGQALICVPSAFAKSWVENKYHKTIVQALERITEKPIRRVEYRVENLKNLLATPAPVAAPTPTLEFGITTATSSPEHSSEPTPFFSSPNSGGSNDPNDDFSPSSTSAGSFTLNPKYTFDTFVVGKTSELAYAAAQAVVSRPGVSYNPLFIYGGVGLGKTHLIQAIGNELRKRKPDIAIMYVSAEKFSNDFITSVKEGTAKQFQDKYRHIDLLLIDDIQFIAGKDRTQESFFHTFNELHQQNKQVVLTSDRPPKAIPALEDRLKSRFGWGMIADISIPDFETRTAILEKKCMEKQYDLELPVLQTIASMIQSNIRELEGALNKVLVFHQMKNLTPTVDSVKSLLGGGDHPNARTTITAAQLIQTVTQIYNLTEEEILGKSREKKISFPRQIIMYLMREELKMSYPSIGDELGGRDHTTAIHAHEKIKNEVEDNLKLKQEIESIKQRLYINNI